MTKLRLWLVVAALAGFPGAAYAQGGFLDFMENLSGPGPYNYGFAADVRAVCRTSYVSNAPDAVKDDVTGLSMKTEWVPSWRSGSDKRNLFPCLTKPKTVQSYIELRYGRATSDVRPLFVDQPTQLIGQIAATTVQAFVMKQLDPSLSLGVGGGGLWITGSTIQGTVFRPILTPVSVVFTPLRLTGSNAWWTRLVIFRFDENAVIGSLTASTFNTASTSTYVAHADMVRSFGIIVDVLGAVTAKRLQ
jgi:hypothetical protein